METTSPLRINEFIKRHPIILAENQTQHAPALTRPAQKELGFGAFLFRYVRPFLLIDIVFGGIALFVYLSLTLPVSFLGIAFFLYCLSFILLMVLRGWSGAWRSRRLAILYAVFVLFILGVFVAVVLTQVGILQIWGIFRAIFWIVERLKYGVVIGAGYVIVSAGFIVLPVMNIGCVVWKRALKPAQFPKVLRVLLNTGSLNLRECVVRISCSLLLLSTFSYATLIEPNMLRVEEIEIVSDKMSAEMTILHLSDMHIHSIGSYEHKLFRRIQQLNPDIIVQTGDLMDLYDSEKRDQATMEKLADLFRQLRPKYGTYWIVGNHDYGLEDITWFHERAGIKLLYDAEWLITGDEGDLRLLGLSCEKSWWAKDKVFIETWLNKTRENDFTIVLGHAPDYILDLTDLEVDLCLAGHLHGGQVRLPLVSRFIIEMSLRALGNHFSAEWAAGYREVNRIRMNVSVGTSGSRSVRFNCPPTITLFRVKNG